MHVFSHGAKESRPTRPCIGFPHSKNFEFLSFRYDSDWLDISTSPSKNNSKNNKQTKNIILVGKRSLLNQPNKSNQQNSK